MNLFFGNRNNCTTITKVHFNCKVIDGISEYLIGNYATETVKNSDGRRSNYFTTDDNNTINYDNGRCCWH